MVVIAKLSGTMTLTLAGQQGIAITQYNKGCAFIVAAELLKPHIRQEAHRYVYFHLWCQGMELVLKGILLLKDYNRFRKIEKNKYGHRLIELFKVASSEFSKNVIKQELLNKIEIIGNLYSRHALRYAGANDIFLNPECLEVEHVFRRFKALIRLANREMYKQAKFVGCGFSKR